MPQLPQARLKNVVVQDIDQELLIYDLISNKALCLNETAKIIWQACDGKTTFEDFRNRTSSEFSDELIYLTLDKLQKKELLSDKFEIPIDRRKMLTKFGALAISLPIITAIVAPTSINAQSICGRCININGLCSTDNCSITCNSGFENCDGDLANGCESNLLSDNFNCGMCGIICIMSTVCVMGKCDL